MLKVPIFDTKMIGKTTKTARNTFLDRVVTKFFQQKIYVQRLCYKNGQGFANRI